MDLVDELDLSAILIPAQAKDPRGEKGFDPGLMQSLSQALLPRLRPWIEVGGTASSLCPKAHLPRQIST
jgi:hypothetical protein